MKLKKNERLFSFQMKKKYFCRKLTDNVRHKNQCCIQSYFKTGIPAWDPKLRPPKLSN